MIVIGLLRREEDFRLDARDRRTQRIVEMDCRVSSRRVDHDREIALRSHLEHAPFHADLERVPKRSLEIRPHLEPPPDTRIFDVDPVGNQLLSVDTNSGIEYVACDLATLLVISPPLTSAQ